VNFCSGELLDMKHPMQRGAFIFLVLLLCGCGMHSGDGDGWHWSSTYRQDIHSIAVPIFTTRDYHRGVEFQLTDALVKKIEEFTPYKVEPRERADTHAATGPVHRHAAGGTVFDYCEFHLEGPAQREGSDGAAEFPADDQLFPDIGRRAVGRVREHGGPSGPGDRARNGGRVVRLFPRSGDAARGFMPSVTNTPGLRLEKRPGKPV
jgi:hypothetical protein